MMQLEHGGALDRAMDQFGGAAGDWLDLSTGINPEAFPLPHIGQALWNRLPGGRLQAAALQAAAAYYGTGAGAGMVAAPGTQALIQIMPDLSKKGVVAIVGPTYQEHALCFSQGGWTLAECRSVEAIPASAKVAVVVNPNNPDGRVVAGQTLLALASEMRRRGGFLVVDEAFADPHPETSLAGHAGLDGLVVLKSFGKFFGLAGVRLGFALGTPAMVRTLERRLGPWAVSGPALAIATHVFSHEARLAQFSARLAARRTLLAHVLADARLEEAGGTMLFSLVEANHAHRLHEALCRQHVLTRKFDYAPQWLRFGVPMDEQEAETLRMRLGRALQT